MGLKSGHKTNYKVVELLFSSIIFLAKHRSLRRLSDVGGPIVDIDASWVVRRCGNMSYDMRVATLLQLCLLFVNSGCRVVIVFDGTTRHHSKRSTTKRTADCHRLKIDFHYNKCLLSSKVLLARTAQDVEKDCILLDINKVKKVIKTIENKLSNEFIDVGEKLVLKVKEQINKIKTDHIENINDVLTCFVAEYQANTVIAYRTINQQNDIVVCSDSDQGILCGKECICINEYYLKKKDNITTLENISINCTSRKTLETISNVLNLPLTSPTIKFPQYPITDNNDIRLQCLIAIGIGCDVIINGVPGITIKKINDCINSKCADINNNESMYDVLFKIFLESKKKEYKKQKKMTMSEIDLVAYKKMINIFIESYLYEPANYVIGDIVDQQQSTSLYMTGDYPSSLHPYNNGFDRKDPRVATAEVDCCVDVCYCVGVGDGYHLFMAAEGIVVCDCCSSVVCLLCSSEIKKENNNASVRYCMDCYGEKRCIPNEETLTNHVSRIEKIQALATVGVALVVDDDINDIDDIYETLITNKQAVYGENITQQIKYPTYPSTYLTSGTKKISPFDVANGGRFFQDNNITIQQKIQLTMLLTELVTLPTKVNNNESNTYQIIPNIIKKFAEGSRVGSGFRLCKRAVRHAMDPRSIDIRKCTGFVIDVEEEQQIGLVLEHKVKASMKTTIYNTKIALTKTTLLACSCTCKAGSSGKEQVVCVHILPVLFQLGQLMWRGMSEHMLVEISNIISNANATTNYLADQQFCNSLRILIRSDTGIDYDMNNNINDLVKIHALSTEQNKFRQILFNKDDNIPKYRPL
jgi:predicted DNA-binding protein YlxM (UPF0122 family)